MTRPIHDIIEALLTKEEFRTLYDAGNSVDREDLRPGMVFITKTGRARIFKEIKSPRGKQKKYVYWQSGGGGSPIYVTLNFRREVTELLYEHHPGLPDRVFPDWITD